MKGILQDGSAALLSSTWWRRREATWVKDNPLAPPTSPAACKLAAGHWDIERLQTTVYSLLVLVILSGLFRPRRDKHGRDRTLLK
jgi:hypothetical protein